jgi:hydroxylamine reductase
LFLYITSLYSPNLFLFCRPFFRFSFVFDFFPSFRPLFFLPSLLFSLRSARLASALARKTVATAARRAVSVPVATASRTRTVARNTNISSNVASARCVSGPMTAAAVPLVMRHQPIVSPTFMRQYSTTRPALADSKMFCMQCEQTQNGTGCDTIGVCGKTPEVAAMQDLLVYQVKGIAQYLSKARALGAAEDEKANTFVREAMFSTLTNVNFDPVAFKNFIAEACRVRDTAKASYEAACEKAGQQVVPLSGPATFSSSLADASEAELETEGRKYGILDRKAALGDDYVGLQELCMYGLKGTCAYFEHANVMGASDTTIDADIQTNLALLADDTVEAGDLLASALEIGGINLRAMASLDGAHTSKLGHPEPTEVSCKPVPGKCILVSGHDLADLEDILIQTEGTGINVYTHGELLPAHSYPGLKKYSHLVGHFGTAWQNQKMDFAAFPGAIVMTTNCLIEPRKVYKNRIFTRTVTGWPGVAHVEGKDFTPVIESAKASEGFIDGKIGLPEKTLTIGFGHNAVLGAAPQVLDAIKSGAVTDFFLIGGCDGSEGERNYFTELAKQTPDTSLILTLGCAKFRLNNLDLGNIGPFPRVLDIGQCNDSYGAIVIASELAKALDTEVNKLPLHFAVSWLEQKAVAVLLTLLHLGITRIRLGPNLPAFVTPNMLNILVEKFNISPTGNVQDQLEEMLKNE